MRREGSWKRRSREEAGKRERDGDAILFWKSSVRTLTGNVSTVESRCANAVGQLHLQILLCHARYSFDKQTNIAILRVIDKSRLHFSQIISFKKNVNKTMYMFLFWSERHSTTVEMMFFLRKKWKLRLYISIWSRINHSLMQVIRRGCLDPLLLFSHADSLWEANDDDDVTISPLLSSPSSLAGAAAGIMHKVAWGARREERRGNLFRGQARKIAAESSNRLSN